MRRLHLYTAREVATPAFFALFVTTFLLFTSQLLRIGEAVFGQGLSAWDFVAILALLFPRFLVFTVPISVLVGVVAGLGRMSDDAEVLALESAGMSVASLWPGPIGLGLVAALGTLFLTTIGEPAALDRLSSRLTWVIEENIARGLSPGLIHEEIPGFMIYARSRNEEGLLEDVFVRVERDDGAATLVARSAEMRPSGTGGLALHLTDGELVRADARRAEPELTRVRFGTATVSIDVGHAIARRVRFIGEIDTLGQAELLERARMAQDDRQRRKLETIYHRRYTTPAACLVFALIGVPLGLWTTRSRRRNRGLAALGAIGAVVGYHLLSKVTEAVAVGGKAPILVALWFPNLLFIGLGLFLYWRRSQR